MAVNVRRSAWVERPAHHVFDVIDRAEDYPRFLPWCAAVTILSRGDDEVSAELRVRMAGLDFALRTRNPKRRPHHMQVRLEQGPFRTFDGAWRLTPLGPQACRVDFVLDWELDRAWMAGAAATVVRRMADSMVDAFVARALALPVVDEPPAPPATPPDAAAAGGPQAAGAPQN